MKLLFNKQTFDGRWFQDNDETDGYTEKVPPDTGHIWDDGKGEWILAPPPQQETEVEADDDLEELTGD